MFDQILDWKLSNASQVSQDVAARLSSKPESERSIFHFSCAGCVEWDYYYWCLFLVSWMWWNSIYFLIITCWCHLFNPFLWPCCQTVLFRRMAHRQTAHPSDCRLWGMMHLHKKMITISEERCYRQTCPIFIGQVAKPPAMIFANVKFRTGYSMLLKVKGMVLFVAIPEEVTYFFCCCILSPKFCSLIKDISRKKRKVWRKHSFGTVVIMLSLNII